MENKLALIKKIIDSTQDSLEQVRRLIVEIADSEEISIDSNKFEHTPSESGPQALSESDKGRIIEGVFDGENMIGPDGKRYSVPSNYASKSKLVEGDILKLTIADDGSFVYKQIGPIERKRLVGELVQDRETREFRVLAGDKAYRVLLASVTYFKGQPGDEAVVLVPKDGKSSWSAVENIIKKSASESLTAESKRSQDDVLSTKDALRGELSLSSDLGL